MKKNIVKLSLIALLLIGAAPFHANAASLYLESSKSTVSVGDTFIVSLKINSENATVNSIDGDVVLSSKENSAVVNDFSLAGSIFGLWPRTPSLSKDGSTISFVGGVAGGFKADKQTVFNIVLEATTPGTLTISPSNISVFANDGKGSKVPVTLGSLSVTVSPKDSSSAPENDWANIIALDKKPPSNFAIVIGRDPSLFDGKRFAFFNAIDNESGVSYYEVREGNNPVIRSGSMYVLANQNENSTPVLTVTVYDKAGNKTVSVYKEPGYKLFGLSVGSVVGIIILALLAFFIVRKIKKNKNRNA